MLLGRQNAAWALLSSEWLSADECRDLGLVFRSASPTTLLETTMTHARLLAAKPISSLRATKRLMTAHHRAAIAAAREGENAAFQVLMQGPRIRRRSPRSRRSAHPTSRTFRPVGDAS